MRLIGWRGGDAVIKLTEAETRTLDKLTDKWRSASKIDERLSTLNALVSVGMAERYCNPDSHFVVRIRTKYRLRSSDAQGLTESEVASILATSFPAWTWVIQQRDLAFSIVVKRGIVLYSLDVPCAEMLNARDVKQAGRIAIVELKDALRRHRKGNIDA